MSKKSVIIQLDTTSQKALQIAGYAMCFAKKVDGIYNVIWQSATKYLPHTTMSWTPEYEVFGTNTYETSIRVQADTNPISIEKGQKCTLDEYGVMGNAETGDNTAANKLGIKVINAYGPIHTGISQRCNFGGVESCIPIYVSKEQRVIGDIIMTPKESVLIWFQANVETSTIFEEARSNAIEIDLTNIDSRTVSYDYTSGRWTLGA